MGNDGLPISLLKPVRIYRICALKATPKHHIQPFMMTNGNCASEKE